MVSKRGNHPSMTRLASDCLRRTDSVLLCCRRPMNLPSNNRPRIQIIFRWSSPLLSCKRRLVRLSTSKRNSSLTTGFKDRRPVGVSPGRITSRKLFRSRIYCLRWSESASFWTMGVRGRRFGLGRFWAALPASLLAWR